MVSSLLHNQLNLPEAQVQVSIGGPRGMCVNVTLPGSARLAVPVVEQALDAYLFEARVSVK